LPQPERYEFDREYVERLIAEDPEIERHFATYFTSLLSIKLRSRLRSKTLVEDAVQETFSRVLAALKSGALQSPDRLGAFVNSVCNNVLFEMYRSGTRTTALEEDYDRADDRTASAESLVVGAEERARVREALQGLSQKERDLLTWLFFDERDKNEVCAELHIDRNYLRVLLHRAKAHFRDQLLNRIY
jgi:RNA polymerase sigma-70 factor (ECF subfamily)